MSIIELIERYPELKVQVQAVSLIHDYQFNKEKLKSILTKYGVKAADEIEKKIRQGEIQKHPSYEDYLEALSHQENMKEAIKEIRKIIDSMESGTG